MTSSPKTPIDGMVTAVGIPYEAFGTAAVGDIVAVGVGGTKCRGTAAEATTGCGRFGAAVAGLGDVAVKSVTEQPMTVAIAKSPSTTPVRLMVVVVQ